MIGSGIWLSYWTPTGQCKCKKCDSVEQARKIGRKLKEKKGYIVSSGTCITEYTNVNGTMVGKIHDLYEEG